MRAELLCSGDCASPVTGPSMLASLYPSYDGSSRSVQTMCQYFLVSLSWRCWGRGT